MQWGSRCESQALIFFFLLLFFWFGESHHADIPKAPMRLWAVAAETSVGLLRTVQWQV
jgi:hypothetical protein